MQVSCTFIQIYQERIFDLLNPVAINKKNLMENPGLRIKLTKADNFAVENVLVQECNTPEELLSVFHYGIKNKVIAATKMNSYSSRSHSMFSINIESFDRKNPVRGQRIITCHEGPRDYEQALAC